jgi:hypothetical protein
MTNALRLSFFDERLFFGANKSWSDTSWRIAFDSDDFLPSFRWKVPTFNFFYGKYESMRFILILLKNCFPFFENLKSFCYRIIIYDYARYNWPFTSKNWLEMNCWRRNWNTKHRTSSRFLSIQWSLSNGRFHHKERLFWNISNNLVLTWH